MQESHNGQNGQRFRDLTFEEKLAWVELVIKAYREEEEAIQRLEEQLAHKQEQFNETKAILDEVFDQLDQRGLVSG